MALKIKLGNAVSSAADKAAQSRSSDGFLAPGEELVLSSSPYACMDPVTMRGFALPETDGVWSSAAVSTIDVRLREVDASRRYRVVIGAIAFEGGSHRALVSIRVNGGPAHQVLAGGSGWSSIVADWEIQVVGKIPMVRIEFQVANPMSPNALGLGDDNRLLGFKVRSLQLLDLGPASTAVAATPVPVQTVAEAEMPEAADAGAVGIFTQSPTETIRALAKRGPILRMLLLDKNSVVRLVRWMRRVSRNMEEMRRQLDLIRIDSARQTRELGERVDNIEIDARVQERERRRAGSSVDAIIERLELNHARLLAIEESAHQAGRMHEQHRDEHADSLESIIATTDGLGRDVAAVLDTLNTTLSESMRMLREFEGVDNKLAGMDRALKLVQKQGEDHARHAISGIRELREQLHLSVQQQQVRSEAAQAGIESSLQGMIERQWSESDELRQHMHSTLQQLENRHQHEREELKRQVQDVLTEGARVLDVRSSVDAEVLRHHVLRLHERLDRLPVIAPGTGAAVYTMGDAAASEQTLQLVAQLHQKLDNSEIETGQILELLVGIKERVETQQLVLSSATGRLASPSQRRVLRRHDGWLIAVGFGTFSCAESDDLLAMCLLESGDVELGLRLFLEHALKPGDVFLDAGANIGLHTVAAANVVGPSGRIFAAEAMPRTQEHLRASLRLSGVEDRVQVLPVALGAHNEDGREFHIGAVAGHSSLYPLDGELEVVRVDVRTVDGLLGEQSVALAKIDVEGAELEVLAGMRQLLAANPAMGIIAEYAVSHLGRSGTSEAEWDAFRSGHGFDLYRIDDLTGACLRLEGFADLRGYASSNILLCPPASLLPAAVVAGGAQ